MYNLLVINHFPTIFPPNTGGVLRYYHIYKQLSRFYDITLLSQKFTPEVELVIYSDTLREVKIPTNEVQHQLDLQLMGESTGPRFSTHSALSCALLDEPPPEFLKYYKQYYKKSDMVIFDSPFPFKYDIRFGSDKKPRIYNSHNHESEFARQVWYGERSNEYIQYVTQIEKNLVKHAKLVFATSEEDKNSFVQAFKVPKNKIKLSPNGVNPQEWKPRSSHRLVDSKVTALFIGSKHQPNIEIVKFIVFTLAAQCPDIEFVIAGQCGPEVPNVNMPNVEIMGEIDHAQKIDLFSKVDIAINPAFMGTGTKIKTLEMLSAGIPLFSTDIGVKGMRLIDRKHYFHATHSNFVSALNEFSHNRTLLKKVALSGQTYINDNYSWKSIARSMKIQFDALLS